MSTTQSANPSRSFTRVQIVHQGPDRLVAWTMWTHQTIWMLPRMLPGSAPAAWTPGCSPPSASSTSPAASAVVLQTGDDSAVIGMGGRVRRRGGRAMTAAGVHRGSRGTLTSLGFAASVPRPRSCGAPSRRTVSTTDGGREGLVDPGRAPTSPLGLGPACYAAARRDLTCQVRLANPRRDESEPPDCR
jgi:hypothetical protein